MARNEKLISKSGTLFENEESNEITNSLKLFAAMVLENSDYSDFRTPIEDIKKDFENNGVDVDENNVVNVDENNVVDVDENNGVDVNEFNKVRDEGHLMSPAQGRESYGISRGTRKAHKKKSANAHKQFCVFCENNKEPLSVVRSHAVRDALGRVVCPVLRSYKCPLCNAYGDNAHTIKYCPKRPIITMEDTILAESLGKIYPYTNVISILNF